MIFQRLKYKLLIWAGILLCTAACSGTAQASKIVHFETVMGNFDVELYDTIAPLHVANFLDNYVTPGNYDGSFFHRLTLPNTGLEVLQGGGFGFNFNTNQIYNVPTAGTVNNEFNAAYGNVRGTLALARPPGGLNTGSGQWFFNLVDNSAALDPQSFTVFGKVIGNGLAVLDAIQALPTYNATIFHPAFGELPLRNNAVNAMTGLNGLGKDLVIITSVSLVADPVSVPEPGAILLGLTSLCGFLGFCYVRLRAQRTLALQPLPVKSE